MTANTLTDPVSSPGSHRTGRLALLSLLTLGLVLLLAATAAAKVVHLEEGKFDGSDTPAPPFGSVWGTAVDNSGGAHDGDVYVTEVPDFQGGPGEVHRFDSDGNYDGLTFNGAATPAGFFSTLKVPQALTNGLAIDDSSGPKSGYVYVVDGVNKAVDVFDPSGTYICQYTGKATPSVSECAAVGGATPFTMNPTSVAVNPTDGHVYIGSVTGGRIFEFDESGTFLRTIVDPTGAFVADLDFTATGAMYAVIGNPLAGAGTLSKFDATGTFLETVPTVRPLQFIAIDRGAGQIYASTAALKIDQYDEAGAHVSEFDAAGTSLAAGSTAHRVYTTPLSFAAEVTIWGPPVTIPDAVTQPASAVQEVTATLNGSADPAGGGDVESCEFEYGTDSSYGSTVPCSPGTPYSTAANVSAGLSGLAASTEYHFRIVAHNSNGVNSFGEDLSFITKGPPTVDSQSIENITRAGGEVVGSVNPHGYSTSFIVKYVDQEQYEIDGFASAQATSPVVIGAQEAPQGVSQAIAGLTVGTKYHYRIVATSTSGTAQGPDASFTTVPIAGVGDQYVAIEGLRSAKLEAEINPLGLATACKVEWVTAEKFDASGYANATAVPCDPANLGAGTEVLEPRVILTGLELASKYHFRFVVSNSSGTFVAPDQEFGTFGIKTFTIEAIDDEGNAETRAGARPYELVSKIELNTTKVQPDDPAGRVRATGVVKDILAELPAGLIGNPEALPKCTRRVVEETNCTGDAQVGMMSVNITGGVGALGAEGWIERGIYNIDPPKGKPAAFASNYFNVSINGFVEAGIRTGGDYGITAGATNIIEIANVVGVELRMWGVPADPRHDEKRECAFVKVCASNAEPKPFLRNPTSCTGGLAIDAIADSFNAPGQFVSKRSTMPAMTSCNQVEFGPTIEARPTTDVTDSPSGLHVDIAVPQNEDTEGIATADLRDAVVKLPAGLVVNPSGANGLAACSPSQIDIDGPGAATCPDDAKIGTVEVDTPLVDHPLNGAVYHATPHQNPFVSLLAIYIAIDDPQTGVVIKLAGHVQPDPRTGQLTTTFEDNPQLPFNHFRVDFFSGAKAPLRTPQTCGTYATESTLTPWSAPESGPPATPSDSYRMTKAPGNGDCATSESTLPNKPGFSAGTVAPIAGAYSPMNVNIDRNDGSQQFSRVTIAPPPGLLARLVGTTYCPESALAAAASRSGAAEKSSPSCPASSEVGSVDVGAGAGPAPYYVTGRAYLAGPYKGAPLSLAIVTPAAAGPFDLGTIVTRVALKVDPATTKITAESDPIPTILEGIQLDVRSIRVKLDRPQFTRNPTSCDPQTLGGELISTLTQAVGLSNPFQVADCTGLGFKPRLKLQLRGKTKRSGNPALTATLTMPEGSAGIARASVRLPHSEFLDQSHIGTVCTRVQFAQDACPAASVYGRAQAYSPLLAQPLEGPVYLRSSSNKLPDLVADLHGQIDVEVSARIDSVKGGIRSTFEGVPDAPVSKFVLRMRGGKKGLLENSTNICRGKHRATVQFDAHSGKVSDFKSLLRPSGCKGKKKASKRKHRATGGK